MKSVLLSVRPEWVAKILNGEKTIEIRKKFPSDYVGWVYIYVTKNHKHASWKNRDTLKRDSHDGKPTNHFQLWTDDMVEDKDKLNGKVVARFWCDRVDEILNKKNGNFYTNFLSNRKLLTQSCLTQNELRDYMAGNWKQKFGYWHGGYAIHITNLEVFDKPKDIREFSKKEFDSFITGQIEHYKCPLTRAPQSFMFIEV